jgi:hypothetical protein
MGVHGISQQDLTDYLNALSGNTRMISTSLDRVSQQLAWSCSEYLNKHLTKYLDALLLGIAQIILIRIAE